MRKSMVLGCGVLILLAFLSSEVLAQGGKITVGKLKVIPSLALEEVYDDNIYLGSGINDTTELIESDWIFHVMPGLMLDYTMEGRGYLRVGYLGDYAYYNEFDENDWKNHKGFLDFDYQAPGGLMFGVKNVYVDAADPYGSDNQFKLGQPQTKRWYNDFNSKIGYNFSNQFRTFLYYDYYKQDYDLDADFTQDYTVNQFGAGFQMRVASKTWGFLRYHYGYRDYYTHLDGSGVTDQNDADFDFHRVSTGLTWDSGAKFAGELNFGYEWRTNDNEFDSLGRQYEGRDTWVAATRLNYYATSTTTLSLALLRAVRDTGSDTFQYYTDTGIRLGLAQVFLSRFTLTAEVGYALYEYNFPTDPTKEADNYLGNIGVSYKIWDWLNAGVAYTYLKQDSNYPEDDYKDNRFSVSLRAVY